MLKIQKPTARSSDFVWVLYGFYQIGLACLKTLGLLMLGFLGMCFTLLVAWIAIQTIGVFIFATLVAGTLAVLLGFKVKMQGRIITNPTNPTNPVN